MFEMLTTEKEPTAWMLFKLVAGLAAIVAVCSAPFVIIKGVTTRNVTPVLDTYSVQNVKRLSRAANDMSSGLEAELATLSVYSDNVENYKTLYGDDTAQWPLGKRAEYQQEQRLYSQAVSAFNTNCGKYNSLWQDEWQSVVAPRDLPERCVPFGEK